MSTKSTDRTITLQTVKDRILAFQKARGWDALEARDLAISIALEAAELLEHFQWSRDIDVVRKRQAIVDELADTFICVMELALLLDIDLAAAFESKLKRIEAKYPTSIFKAGDPIDDEAYQRIKKSYRAKGGGA